MADVRGSSATCNERCGCPSPCPGGVACRCTGEDASMEHKRCSCGEHCGCNPCTCPKSDGSTAATGKAHCKCGPGCTCLTCAA